MARRPVAASVIGWLFALVGGASAVRGLLRYSGTVGPGRPGPPGSNELLDLGLVLLSAILAVVGGVLVLRGRTAGRWLCLIWMALHVLLSLFHSVAELTIHATFLLALCAFLFRGGAAAYFRQSSPRPLP